jgi:preprotein translocase subunit SecE
MDFSGLEIVVTLILGAVLALVVALGVSTMSVDPNAWRRRLVEWVTQGRTFLEECWGELRRVQWPTWDETRMATMAVIVGVIIVGVYLGVIDSVLTFVFSRVLS